MINKIKNLLALLFFIFSIGGAAQIQPPKLILTIVIDELDNDLLLLLQSSFSEKGINRISREGFRFMSATSYDFAGYPGTRLTSIYTGVNVAEHGIVGERWYNQNKEFFTEKASFDNPNSLKEALKSNMARTLGDYFKSFYGQQAGVASISINSPYMVHTLGYKPDYFFTINPENAQFYETLTFNDYFWVNEFNSRYSTVNYLTKQWGPLNDITSYVEFRYTDSNNRNNFRNFLYDMNQNGSYEKVIGSPYGNSLLRDFIVAFLVNSKFGQDNIPDLLSVCFNTNSFLKTATTILPAEKEDMILRLDLEIASLIDFLDIELGRKNYLIIFTSATSPPPDTSTFGQQGITTGFFEPEKSMSLLNLYLMALHGQGKWVLGCNDGMIFLNHNLIEQKGLSLKTMQEEVALFMFEYSGIKSALPLHDYILNSHCDNFINRNLFPKRTGDVFISLFQGWQTPKTELGSRQDGKSGFQTVPFIFFGWETEKGAWLENIDVIDIIPLFMKYLELSHSKDYKLENIQVFRTK